MSNAASKRLGDLINLKRGYDLPENQQLAQLRDWLLPLLMNGQVTVT